ncbi:MAG: ABC transporter permease [Candidatus Obscuribacterales bacterium]|nr:ABC transporter permease [Candidatus Obscuribacterales bacterium]
MRSLRIFLRVLRETTIGLRRSGWSNWLVISILAIALTIFGGVLQTTMAIKEVVSSWGSQLEISAYLKDGVEPQKVAKVISQFPDVQIVEIVPKEVAWAEMQSNYKVAALSNPLPNTLHVKLSNVQAVEKTADKLKQLSTIEHIRFPLKVARNLNRFRQFLEIAGFVVTGALSAATLTVIGNTIHLVIESRQREIEILSLTGVSPWYIKGPLILQGASYGLAAALIAGSFLFGLHSYMDPYIHDQLLSFLPMNNTGTEISLLPTFVVVLTLGVAVGAGGSAWTSGRYIKI